MGTASSVNDKKQSRTESHIPCMGNELLFKIRQEKLIFFFESFTHQRIKKMKTTGNSKEQRRCKPAKMMTLIYVYTYIMSVIYSYSYTPHIAIYLHNTYIVSSVYTIKQLKKHTQLVSKSIKKENSSINEHTVQTHAPNEFSFCESFARENFPQSAHMTHISELNIPRGFMIFIIVARLCRLC